MNIELIANIISFAGCILLVCIGLIKTKKNILIAQNIMFVVMSIAYLLLGGFAAVVSNMISMVRNLVCLKWDLNWPLKIIFIALQGAFTLLTNQQGLIGWLPFVAAAGYTIFLDLNDEVQLKLVLIVTQACWILFDFSVHNYSAFAFDIFTVISTIVGIFMILKSRKAAASNDEN